MTHTKEKPFCHVLSPKHKETKCDQCFAYNIREEIELRVCTRCRVVRYCGVDCQKAAWMVHKKECRALKRVAPKIPTDSVLLINRLFILYQLGEHSRKQDTPFGSRSFDDLMSHVPEVKCDQKRCDEFLQVMHTVKAYIGDERTRQLPDPAIMLQIFAKMCINSFTICDGEMQPLGVGIYLGASTLDHSCEPNTVTTFDGVTLQLTHTDAGNGDSTMLISYIEQLSPTQERQSELKEQYYFTCQCPACLDEQRDEEMLSTKCPQLNCEGLVLQGADEHFKPCTLCGSKDLRESYAADKSTAITDVKHVLDNAKQLAKNTDYSSVLSACKTCLDKHRPLLSPTNVYWVRLLDKAFDACIQLSQWEDALQYGIQTLLPYGKYYHKHHPNLGIQILKVGKIELFLKLLTQALEHLQMAESIISVSHGRTHILYTDLTTLLAQCEEESRVNLEFKQ